MKLQILALALLSLGALPAQKKAPNYSKVSRSLLNDLIASKPVDKQVVVLVQASAKELAPLAAWDRRSTELVLAFPESEEMEEGTADGLEAKLEAALVASTVEGAAGQAFVASGKSGWKLLQEFRARFLSAKRELVLACINHARDGQSVYEGQFANLSVFGKGGLKLVIGMLDEKNKLWSAGNEGWLLRVVRDLGVKPGKRQLAQLIEVADNYVLDESIRYLAMLCLADFGDQKRFEAKEAEFRKMSAAHQEWYQRDGWGRLGRLYSDARQHEKAVVAFKKGLELRKAEKDDALAGLRYNLSCSLAKLEQLDEAFAVFDKALAGGKGLSDRLLESDKDLDPLRKDARFEKLMVKYKRMGHAEEAEGEGATKKHGPKKEGAKGGDTKKEEGSTGSGDGR
jgi:tetratricopeptide (TPR) repeat protein